MLFLFVRVFIELALLPGLDLRILLLFQTMLMRFAFGTDEQQGAGPTQLKLAGRNQTVGTSPTCLK